MYVHILKDKLKRVCVIHAHHVLGQSSYGLWLPLCALWHFNIIEVLMHKHIYTNHSHYSFADVLVYVLIECFKNPHRLSAYCALSTPFVFIISFHISTWLVIDFNNICPNSTQKIYFRIFWLNLSKSKSKILQMMPLTNPCN